MDGKESQTIQFFSIFSSLVRFLFHFRIPPQIPDPNKALISMPHVAFTCPFSVLSLQCSCY